MERVEDGSRLVSQADQTMTEIVSSVRRVSDIIAEITASSAEQATTSARSASRCQTGPDDQQNAALVEDPAASESLRERPTTSTAPSASFKLQDGASAWPRPRSLGLVLSPVLPVGSRCRPSDAFKVLLRPRRACG